MDNNLYEDMHTALTPLIAYNLDIGILFCILICSLICIYIGMSIDMGIGTCIGICIAISVFFTRYEERVLANTTEQESVE